MDSRQIEFPNSEEVEIKEIEIPEKCKTEKIEIPISENLEIEETEIPEVEGEVESPIVVEAEQTGVLSVVESDQSEVPGDAETEIQEIDGEQTEIPEVGESVIVESDDGSVEILSKICAQMDTFLESQEAVTEFETESGPIAVVHTITLGDFILATLLAAVLIMQIISNTIRRS